LLKGTARTNCRSSSGATRRRPWSPRNKLAKISTGAFYQFSTAIKTSVSDDIINWPLPVVRGVQNFWLRLHFCFRWICSETFVSFALDFCLNSELNAVSFSKMFKKWLRLHYCSGFSWKNQVRLHSYFWNSHRLRLGYTPTHRLLYTTGRFRSKLLAALLRSSLEEQILQEYCIRFQTAILQVNTAHHSFPVVPLGSVILT